MSFFDYVLPWKAIPNMIKDVKGASSTKGGKKYDSVFGAIGKYADPAGALFGDKWMNFFHGTVPREMNRAIQPWNEFHMKYLDPLAMAGVTPQEMRDVGKYKGADATAAALGATALGMFSGIGGAGGGGGGSGGGIGSMNWQDPNTYMGLLQFPGQSPQQDAQPGPVYAPRGRTQSAARPMGLISTQIPRNSASYNWYRHI